MCIYIYVYILNHYTARTSTPDMPDPEGWEVLGRGGPNLVFSTRFKSTIFALYFINFHHISTSFNMIFIFNYILISYFHMMVFIYFDSRIPVHFMGKTITFPREFHMIFIFPHSFPCGTYMELFHHISI